jgi:DNA polymerase/3'-5' exonuclease PolX
MTLDIARRLAEAIQAEIESACEYVQIVGGVRRNKSICGDVELLVIPRLVDSGAVQSDIFGGQSSDGTKVNQLDRRLEDMLIEKPHIQRIQNGSKKKSFEISKPDGTKVVFELWITTRDQLGLIQMIRTGPRLFSKRAVTDREVKIEEGYYGFLKPGYRSEGGFLCFGPDKIPVPDERRFMGEYLSCGWVEPADREKTGDQR